MGADDRQEFEPWTTRVRQRYPRRPGSEIGVGPRAQGELGARRIVLECQFQHRVRICIHTHSCHKVLPTSSYSSGYREHFRVLLPRLCALISTVKGYLEV